MAWYNTGTIALTNGSATVTGSGTNFLVGAQIGEALYAPDGKLYEIQTINSATVITLASNYLGSTASAQGYQIIPTQSLVADLASDVTDLISDFADVRDYAGNGKFNDGAVGTPGITFTQDQDNGLYRIGSNNWALAAGGQKIVDISTSGIDVTGSVTANGLVVDGASSGSTVATFTANANVDTPLLVFQRTGGAVAGKIAYDDTNTAITFGTTTNHEVRFLTNNTEKMQLTADGNLLINTPITNAFYGISLDYNSLETATFKVNQATGQIKIGGAAAGYYPTFWSGGTERMRIDLNGNTGIAESNPVAKIHIKGSGTSGQVTSSLILENSSSGTAGLQITGAAGSSHLDFMYGGGPSTGTNTLTTGISMTLEGSGAGNVGIGTDSPAIGGGRTYDVALTIDGGVSDGAEDTGALEVGGSTSVNDRLVGSISYFNRDNSGAGATTRRQVAIIEARSVTSDSNAGDDSGANLTFSTKSEGGSVAERLRIDASGHAIIPAGVTLGTAAGVYAAANTLDDYEEGAWTPLITDGTNDATMLAGSGGRYTKIGQAVTYTAQITVDTINSVGADALISGLPFPNIAAGANRSGTAIGYGSSLNITAGRVIAGYVELNQSNIILLEWDSTTGTTSISGSQISDGGTFFISGTYYTAS